MKILFAASELNPLAKVGGLADVVGSLPHALAHLGHDVRVMIPRYGSIDVSLYHPTRVVDKFEVPVMKNVEPAGLTAITLENGVPGYLIENSRYFGSKEVYSDNDLKRYLFFSKAVAQVLPKLDWQPDVIHCHDWHTALIVMWLKKSHYPGASVFTIHNLAYQGFFDEAFLAEAGLEKDWQDFPTEAPRPPLNLMCQGILWADMVTTVSETYAKEILSPEYGERLDPLLRYRQTDLLGIVNGIDYEAYNPEFDPYLPGPYSWATPERRVTNKLVLQKQVNLPRDAAIPLIGMVQRLDEQKGFDILAKAVDPILKETGVQLVILGRGREHYENMLKEIAARYPRQVALFVTFDNSLAHLIYAGSDLFLMPSRFEPCGLGQLIAMRYGSVPVVRHTGGLVDTVPELTPDLAKGNGFIFQDYTPEALIAAVKKGVDAFRDKRDWDKVVQRVMRIDFSWRASAAKYEAAYRQALKKSGKIVPE